MGKLIHSYLLEQTGLGGVEGLPLLLLRAGAQLCFSPERGADGTNTGPELDAGKSLGPDLPHFFAFMEMNIEDGGSHLRNRTEHKYVNRSARMTILLFIIVKSVVSLGFLPPGVGGQYITCDGSPPKQCVGQHPGQ